MWFIAPLAGVAVRAVASTAARGFAGTLGRSIARFAGRHALRDLLDGSDDGPVVHLHIDTNLGDTGRYIGDVGKQVRYATAVALTRTVRRLQTVMEREVQRSFSNPTPFTKRAFGTTPANKATLAATLFIKPKQAAYLRPSIQGGRRQQKPFERRLVGDARVDGFWAPGEGVRLNAAGNLTRNQITEIATSLRRSGRYGEVFVGVPRGHTNAPFGIWARPKRNPRGAIKPLLVKIQQPNYRKQFDFYGIAKREAGKIFDQEFHRAFNDAVRTVRPISSQMQRIATLIIGR